MTAATTVYMPTPSQTASMKMHLSRRDQWVYARVNGQAIIVMPSSDGKRLYYVGQRGECCVCEGSRRYPMCSHMWAAREASTQDALSTFIADAADDLLAEYDARRPVTTWRSCKRQCGAMLAPEAPGSLCSGCVERGLMLLFRDVED